MTSARPEVSITVSHAIIFTPLRCDSKAKYTVATIVLLALLVAIQVESTSVTLSVAAWQPADDSDILAVEAIQEFEKDFPEVKVEWLTVPWSEYWESIPVQHAAGVAPDVLWVTFGEMDVSWAKLGIFEPLGRYVDAEYLSDFDKPVIEAATMDGELYYIPGRVGILVWVYNTDLVQRAGLAEPGYSWTWDTYLDYAKKLTRRTNEGRASVYGTHVADWPLHMYEFIFGAGGNLFDDPGTILPNEAVYNRGEALRGFTFYADLAAKHRVAPLWGEGDFSFPGGTIAIFQDGSNILVRLSELAPWLEYGATLAPRDKVPYVAQGGGTGYGISSQSKHKDLAWELIKRLQSTEVLARIGAGDGATVTRKSARRQLDRNLWHNRLWLEAGQYYDPVSVVGFQEVLVQPLGDAMRSVLRGEGPYEQLLDKAVQQSNIALNEWRFRH